MYTNVKPSDRAVLLSVIDPQSATTVKSTGWINLGLFDSALAVIAVGVLGSSTTVDAKLEQATTAAGAGVKDITGKGITQLTQAGTDDNKQVLINVRAADLDIPNSFAFVRLTVTPATSTALLFGALFGMDPKYGPATDATTVDQIVG